MQEVIQFLGGVTVLIAAVAWLARSIVVHILTKDIELFKRTLTVEAEKDIAILKSQLELENEKVRIKLAGLEARRVAILEELYMKLSEFSKCAGLFSYRIEREKENHLLLKQEAENFVSEYFEFYRFFKKIEIFLPKHLEDSIESLHEEYFFTALELSNSHEKINEENLNRIINSISVVDSKTNNIVNSIAKEFRDLLGVNS